MEGVTQTRHRTRLGTAAPFRIAVILALGVTAAGCASTLSGGGESAEAAHQRLQESKAAARGNDNLRANTLAKKAVASTGFRHMSDSERHETYTMVSATAALLNHPEECYRYARISTDMRNSWNDEWRLRAVCAYSTKRWADASYALTKIASTWPNDLSDHADSDYLAVWNQLRPLPDGAARRFSLGAWMVRAGWKPKCRPEAFAGVWQELAELEDAAARPDLRDAALARAIQPGGPSPQRSDTKESLGTVTPGGASGPPVADVQSDTTC